MQSFDLQRKQVEVFKRWQGAPLEEKGSLWGDYQAITNQLVAQVRKDNPYTNEGAVARELQRVVEEEMKRLPTDRKLTQTETQRFVDDIERRVTPVVTNRLENLMRGSARLGVEHVARDVGLKLAPTVAETEMVRRLVQSAPTQQALGALSESLKTSFLDILTEAYSTGQLTPGKVTLRIIDEVGWEQRGRIERIAAAETWKAQMTGEYEAYKEAERIRGEKFRYQFGTIVDTKTCKVCREIMSRTAGGVEMEQMVKIINDVATDPALGGSEKWDPMAGGGFPLPHVACRHRHYRRVRV